MDWPAARGQPLLDERHLAPAEEGARLVQLVADGARLGVAAGLVGAVLALVEEDQLDRPAEPQRAVDAVRAARRAERGHALEVGAVAEAVVLTGEEGEARRLARVRRRRGAEAADLALRATVENRYQYTSCARRPPTRALTECAARFEVRTSSRATTLRKPRSRATSSSTVPAPPRPPRASTA
jgi:hypothetical protein